MYACVKYYETFDSKYVQELAHKYYHVIFFSRKSLSPQSAKIAEMSDHSGVPDYIACLRTQNSNTRVYK
jgi:hypothetical protein